jgi:steroid 5-alpha reductase family enzyme
VWFKHRAWVPVAWILSLVNVGAVWFAAGPGEAWHATTHALLAVLFAVGAQHLARRNRSTVGEDVVTWSDLKTRLGTLDSNQVIQSNQVNQSIEAIAVEVERIGESQRYLAKLLTERDVREH